MAAQAAAMPQMQPMNQIPGSFATTPNSLLGAAQPARQTYQQATLQQQLMQQQLLQQQALQQKALPQAPAQPTPLVPTEQNRTAAFSYPPAGQVLR